MLAWLTLPLSPRGGSEGERADGSGFVNRVGGWEGGDLEGKCGHWSRFFYLFIYLFIYLFMVSWKERKKERKKKERKKERKKKER